MTQRIVFFLNVTQRIEFLSLSKKKKTTQRIELFPEIRYKELKSFQYVSKIFFNMTRRIEPFFITWFKDLVFSHQNKNSKIFSKLTDLNLLKNIFKKKNDSKNWFFLNFIHRIEHLFRTQLTELNALFNMTHRNWTHFFSTWLIEIEPIFLNVILSGKMTQRIEPFCFFQQWLKWLNSLYMTHSIEPLLWTSSQ